MIEKKFLEIATSLGFRKAMDTAGLTNITKYFDGEALGGIYLLDYGEGLYYIGQAINITTRFVRHRERGENILRLAFRSVQKDRLNDEEAKNIDEALQLGLKLTNKILPKQSRSPKILKESGITFDEYFPAQKQDEWLNDLASTPSLNARRKLILKDSDGAHIKDWHDFQSLPQAKKTLSIASLFLKRVVPLSEECAGVFWGVSILSRQNIEASVPLLRLLAGQYKMLEVMYFHRCPEQCFVSLSAYPAALLAAYQTKSAVEKAFSWCTFSWPDKEKNLANIKDLIQKDPFSRAHLESPQKRAAELSRALSRVDPGLLLRIETPAEGFNALIEDANIALALSMAFIAAMRRHCLAQDMLHNPIVSFELLYGNH